MAILGLATSGPISRVGIVGHDRVLAEGAPLGPRSRGTDLLPTVAELLREQGLSPADLTGIVADIGPGSFTGTRLGVTAAKTLAYAIGCPVVGVGSLEALAHDAPVERPALAIRDAGRGTLYLALFAPAEGGEPRTPLRAPARMRPEMLPALPTNTALIGEVLAPALQAWLATRDEAAQWSQHPADTSLDALRRLGVPRLAKGAGAETAHTLVPAYLQASAPEEALRADAATPHGPSA